MGVTTILGTHIFCRRVLWWACFALLFPFALLSSSSEADNIAPWRSVPELERLWGGVLGCTHPGEDDARPTFETTIENTGAPSAVRHDYAECGKRALRNTSSRMLVNTIEGAVRSGGVALFSERFRLDSSIGWIWREGANGAVDAVIPLLDGKNSDGTGHALFLQPGAVFWQGIESVDRIDANLGIAFRRHFTPDVIGGWSGFYDYDFKRKHRRLGIGMDIQSGVFHTAVNYYYPLNEWQEGRTGYEEQPLEGVDLRLGLEWPRIRLDASVAAWRFEGEIDEETKWRPSFSAEAGFHILPGIFLEAGYERQDEDSSIGSQWSTGLAFRFTVPGLDGLNAFEDSTAAPNLFEPVKREKRILYEERQRLPRATLTAMPARVEEGDDVTVRVVLGKALEEDVFFSVAALSSSTADADDYDPLPLRITISAGLTSAEATFEILDDLDSEPDEILDLELRVLPESFFFVARGDTHRARVIIDASDNSIVGFATESTYVAEGVEVHVPLALGEPAPPDGLVLVASSDKDDVVVDGEMRISPGAREGQYIRVTVNADDIPEDTEMARIVLLESSSLLPEGWRFSRSEHMLTILPNDQTAMFAKASESFDEDAGSVSFEVTLSADAPEGGVPLEVSIASGNEDGDVTFTTQSFTIAEGENEHTLTVDINDDDLVETNEVVTFTLSKDASAVFPDEWGDLGAQTTYRLTITDDDSTSVGFASSSSTLTEGGTTAILTVRLNGYVSQDVVVTLNESGDGNNDLSFSPSSLAFAPGETEKEVTLTVNAANDDAVPEADFGITYRLEGTLPSGVSFNPQEHVVTFTDDDKTIRFRDASSSVSEGTTGHQVAVVLNFDPPAEGLEVTGVATGEHKNEVSIPSSDLRFTGNARELSVSVDVLEDSIREDAEVVRLELQDLGGSLPDGWTLLASGNNDHDLTILPSDQAAMFAETGRTVNEGDGTITFKVMLSADAPAGGVPLEVAITSGNGNGDVIFATQRFSITEGSREHTISVDVNDDNQVEPEEVVRFTLSKGASAAFPDAWGDLGTQTTFDLAITDNDSATVGFTTASSTLLESNASAVLTVSLVGSVSQDVVVTLSESGDGNNDLEVAPDSLTFAPGERSKHVTLTVNAANNDTTPERDVEITYTLAGTLPNAVTFAAKEHVVTLVDDDKTVGFRESSSSAGEGTDGHSIAVVLNFDPPAGGLEVSAAVESVHTLDVSIPSPTLDFTGGTRELPLLVNVLGDNLPEGAESIELTLSGQLPETWNYAQRTHDLMVPPNENEIAFERASTSVNEDGGTVNVALKLNRPAPEGMVLAFRSSSPSDAVPASSTLQVPAGARDAMLAVNIVNDGIGELEDTVTISILGNSPTVLPEGWSIGSQDTHDLIVTDDDLVVGFERASSQVRESDLTTDLPIVLSEIGAPTGGINLSVSATGNEGNDVSFPSILPISTGEDRKELMVALTQDGFAEENEVIVLALSGSLPPPWRFSQETHQLTILLNEQTAMFAEAGKTAGEGDGTTAFKVRLSADAPSGGVPLEVAISSGNENNDVTFTTQRFTIAEGAREHTLTVDINEDALVEPSETVTFALSKDASATFPDAWGDLGAQTVFELTITDNDSTTVGFTTSSTTLLEGDASAILTVRLNGSVSQDVVVTLNESGDDNSDLSFPPDALTFAPGETDKQVALTVNNANNDALAEGDVEITYTLTGTLPGGVNFATSEHVVTFVDDDKTISFKASSSSASEGTVGHPVAVVLNFDPPAEGLHVAATATGDHAADVSIPSPTLNFTGNTRELSVLVNVLEDVAQEGVEIVLLELGEAATPLPAGWTLLASGANDHDLTILPSDQTAMFAEAGKTADEGDGTISFRVELSADAPVGGVPLEVVITSGNENNDVTFATQSFTIAQGTRARTLTVDVNDDSLVEPDETITFTLSKDASATFPDAWGDLGTQTTFDITITDNDASTVGFALGSSILREGDGTATLSVVLTNPVSQDVVVALTESGDTNDQVAFTSNSLTFAAGETSRNVTLTVVDDNKVEPGATITYTLTGTLPDDVFLGTDNHVVTFIDDDSATVGFTYSSSTLSEGDSTTNLTVELSAPVSQDVMVVLTESGDDNNDLEFTPTSLTFAPGDTSHDVTLTVSSVNDNQVEEDVEITYTLTGTLPDDVGFGTNSHVVTFTDDDSSTVGFASGNSILREGDGTSTLRVVLSNPVSRDVVVALSESGDANDHVAFTPNSLTFAAGETSHNVTLTVVDDNTVEEDATITYTLTGSFPDDVSLGTANHVVVFMDDDTSTVGFASSSSTLSENDGTATLSVMLTNPVSGDVVVALSESGDTNNEVAFSPGLLTFASGETSKEITLTVVDDNTVEPGATITYTLTGTLPDDVSLGTRDHVVTLIDDDSSTIGFTMPSSTLSEGDSTAKLTVELSAPVSQDVIVTLSESGDDNNDIEFAPSSLTFVSGETSKEVTLTVSIANNDNKVEEDVDITYTLTGSLPDGVSLGADKHVVTFADDDTSTVGFASSSSTLSENDGMATLSVVLTNPVSQDVVVALSESGDTNNEVAFSPGLLTFASGETSKDVTLTVQNDSKVEPGATITYTLTGTLPDDVSLGAREHVVTFMDDDTSTVGFASGSSTLREGDGTATLRVTLTNPVSQDVIVMLSESGDEGGEVSFAPSSLTFASGQTSKEITLTVVNDNKVEPGATITYTLTGSSLPDDVSLGTRDHVVTFIDDDSATVGFATASSTLSEGDSTDTLTVSLSAEVSQDVVVTLTESGDGNNDLTFSPSSMTFASGETDKQLTLTVNAANNDNKVEEDVEITYTLTGAFSGNVRLDASRNTHVVTFMDDDSAMVGFTAPSSTLNEGDSTDTLTVSLSAEVSREVVVDLTESGDVNNDLTFSPAALTFAPGETSKQVTLTVNASNSDNKVEEDVEITYTLTGTLPDDVTISTASHVVTFTDDDSATVGFASGSSTLREGDGTATLRVVLTNPVSQDVVVALSESGDTNNEVAFSPSSLTFAPGDTSKDVTLTVVDDNRVEPGATITYTLALAGTLPDDVSLGTRDHVVTFIDDDSSTIGFTAASSTLSEGDSTTNLTVELSAPVSQDVMVVLTESGDDNNDLIISPETLTFAPGETDKQVTLTVNASNNDNKVEGDVQITYTLTGSFPDDVTLGTREHVVTFTDDDTSIVGFASGSSTLREGDGTATLRVELTNPVSEDVVLALSESGDEGGEVSFAPSLLTFASGETSHNVTLTVVDDNRVEPGATITYTLTGSLPDDVSLGTDNHVVAFIDDDSSTIGFTTASSTLREDNGTATLRVVLTNPVSEDVIVTLSESGDTNNEVSFAPGSLTFTSGQTSKEITLTVVDDNTVEPGATITYTLTGTLPDDVTLGTREHVVTFMDDDSSTIGFSATSSTLSEGDSSGNLTVSLSAPVSQDVIVTLTESGDDNNDLTFSPSSLTFAPGETSHDVTLTVNTANNDNKVEEDVEITYTLTGTPPDDVGFGTSSHVVTFADDDSSEVGFASGSSTLREDDGNATLRVVLSNPVSQDVIVTLTESGDTNDQVAFTPNSLTFAGGETSHNVTLTVVDDNTVEPGATVTYTLTGTLPDDVSLGTRDHVVTFIDDDSATIGFATALSTLSESDNTNTLTISLSAPSAQTVTVTLTESGDDNNDLIISPETLTFAPGVMDKQVTLTVNAANNDNKVEEDVDITYTLTGAFSGNVRLDASRNTHVVTFTDDDSATVGFTSSSSTLSEDETSTASLTVSLSAEVSQEVVVDMTESGDGNSDLEFAPTSLTFAPGETSKQVTLTVNAANNDNKVEGDVQITYTLTGSFPDDVTLGTREHVVTFTDDDSATVGFASGSSTLSEDDGTATLRVVLSNPVSEDVVLALNESGDANNEVAFTPISLTFASGQTSKEITLTVENDNKVEPGATIIYTLTGSLPDDVTLDIREHMVTLTDDDSATVGFTSSSSTLSEDETSPASLTVSLSAEVSQGVVVTLTESGDDNNDLEFAPTSLTFAPGERSKQVTLTVNAANNDNKVEEDVEITYTLAGAFSGNVGLDTSRTTHVVTFTDDDASIVGFASSSSALSENDGTEILSVVLTNPVSQDVIVTLTESGDINNQVAFTPNSLTFAGGETSHNVTLTVVDDKTVEPGATITYTLTGSLPDDVSLGAREHVVTLTDDDTSIIGFASSGSTLREGDGTATLSVVLTNPVSEDVVVTLNESGDGNDDLTFSPSSLLFTPGETSHNVTLTVSSADDNRVEEDVEITYTLTGSNLPADVSLSTSSHVVTFADDDSATVGFASGSSTLRENEGTATLRVELTNPVSEDVIVTLSESGDVNDQVAFSPSSVIFASGQTSKEITLTVVDDNTVEPGATITYTLAGTLPGNLDVSFGTRDHVVTFIDDDSSTIGFTTALSTLSEGDSTTNLTVELSAPSAQLVTVTLTESGDGNNDLTFSPDSLTFTPGERSKQVTLSVNASNNDNKVEEDVEITYTLTGTFSGSVRLDASRTTHVVTFTDDDSATVGFASSSSTLSEDETSTASLTVSLSAEVSQGVVVDLTESGDDNGDLIISPETLTFAPGETSKQVTLTVNTANNDTAPEGDVEITYTLGGTLPDDVSLGTREHVVTFTDDDKTISFKEFSSSASEGTIGHSVAVVLNFDPPAEGLEVSAVAKGDHKDDVSIPLPVLNFTGSTRELPVLVDVLDDIEQEDAEVVQLELEETSTPLPLGWTLIASGDNDHDLTIEPNDKTIGFADTLPAEIEEGAGDLPLEIVWNAPISHSVSLDLGVELEKADDGDSQNDVTLSAFVTASQTPSMITEYDTNAYIPRFYSNQPASGSSQRLTIRVVDDAIAEEDEEVIVRLVPQEGRSLPAGWSIDPAEYRFTIPANDNSVEFADPLEQTVEEDVGEVMIPLNVTSVPPTDGLPLRVEIAGHGRHAETATTDDYSFDPLAFTLMPAEAGEGYNLVFSITDDDLPETRETFAITLHAGEGFPTGWGGLGEKTTRYLTIWYNDKTIGFADTLPAELEEGTLNFPLEVVWNVGILDWERLRLGVELEKAAGGGTDPEEFDVLLEFPPDTFNEFQDTSHESDYLTYTGSAGSDTRIEMNVQDDKLLEEDEEIVVRLVPKQESPLPDGWSIDPAEYRFTIPANDKFVGFAAADSSLVEPNGDPGAQVSGNVVVKLNGPAPVGGLNLVVSVNEENNDDGGNIDANVAIGEGGVLFISEGATEISFPVTALEDDIAESNEPVVLTLSKGANWPELWEIGGIAETGNLSGTHTVTILGNDKKVGFRDAVRKLVSEANYASVSPVVTNYPAPAGGLRLSVEVVPHTGLYARANVLEDGAKDLSYQENVHIRPNSRFEAVNSVAPLDDGIAEPDEAAVFRLSVAGGGQLPPGWEWSNQDLEVIILANDNDFTFTDGDNDDSKGSYSEGTTVRLTAVVTNPLPPLESEEYYANFRTRVGYFGIEVTENSEDISITPVAPVIYHPDYHHPDGSRKGLSQPIKGGQEIFADYAFTVTEGDLNSLAFDVAINRDSETEPPETVVITLSISGGWGLRPTTRQYTLTINDEGGTGMVGFSQAEIDRGPYGLYEKPSLSTQRPGVLVELSSPAPAGGIDLVMRSSDPGQLLVGGNIRVPENRRGCYVTQLPVSTGSNYHFPEHRERCRFTDFNTISDGIPEGDETYEIIISEDPARPLPPKWSIDSERSRREVTIYSSDNKVGIAGFVDPDSGSIPENGPIPIEMIEKSVSLDEDEGLARLVLNVPNDPVPGGLRLRLKVTPDATTPGASVADFDNIYRDNDFIIPRRNQAGPFQHVIEIPITDDTDAEQLESFSFALQFQHSSGNHNTWGNIDWGNNSATLKINQNDQTIQFYDSSVEIAEGPPGYAYLYFTSPALKPVPFMFHADTPIDGVNFASTLTVQVNDYEMKDLGQQQFHAWKFPISVVDDETSEGKQSFTLSVTPGTNFPKSHTLDPEHSSIEIIIPESDNLVSFMNVATEVNEDVGTVGVTLTLTNPAPAGGLPLRIDTVSVNAAGVISNDFDFVNGNEFTIMPEDGLQYTFTVNIDDDDLAENTETYDLVLQKRRNFPDGWGTLNERAAHPLTILENDQKISWAEESVEIIEGEEKPLILNFPSSIPEDAPARVSFRVENNSDRDISFPPSEVRISGAQASSYSLQVTANEDTDREGGETFIIVATGHDFPSSYAQDQEASIQVTIPANNNLVGFVGSSIEVEEDVGSINLTLNLTGDTPPSGLRMRLNISGQHQHADIGGTVSHNFTIPWRNETGSFQHVIPIPITDDDDTEDDKLITFGLSLLDNSWGEIDTNNDEFDLTILKNDQWFGFIAEPSVEIAEGTEEDVYLYFSEPVPHPATFMFHTDTPIDGVNFASTLTVEVEEYEMKELGGLEFHAWKFPISVTDDEITEGEQSFRLHVTSGPNVPDYYTVDPVESYIDIIIPGSDNLVDFKRGATSISKNTGKINVELRLTNPAPAGGLPLRIPALGGDADEIFDFKEYDNEFTILPIHGLEYTLGINIKNTKDIQFVNGQQSYHFTIEKSGEDFPDSWGTLGEQTLHILVIHE